MFHANVESKKKIQEEVEKDPIGKEPRPAAQPALFHFLALPRALSRCLCVFHTGRSMAEAADRVRAKRKARSPQQAEVGRSVVLSVGRGTAWLGWKEGRRWEAVSLAAGCKKKALTAVRRPRAVGPQRPSLPAKYHKEAEEEGRDSLDISTAAAASALVSLAANQPAGNLALRAPTERKRTRKETRR